MHRIPAVQYSPYGKVIVSTQFKWNGDRFFTLSQNSSAQREEKDKEAKIQFWHKGPVMLRQTYDLYFISRRVSLARRSFSEGGWRRRAGDSADFDQNAVSFLATVRWLFLMRSR